MSENTYETDELLHQYLVFHYGTAEDQFPYTFGGSDALDFPKRCALKGPAQEADLRQGRALDLGCAVGRSTFELARHYQEVIGIDYSHIFINAANSLKRDGSCMASRQDEGSVTTNLELQVDTSIDRSRVSFEQGDALSIRDDIGQFDLVLACNLICRLKEPLHLIRRLTDLVKPGGCLFLTTPFTWMESYTPKANWLGNGSEDSFDGLRRGLEPAFTLDADWDMPFIIREHTRKFQYSIAKASRWRRI
jgi:putative 4-mercaptohistidine N1-methyltranferase